MSHIKNFKDWFRVYESAGFRYQPGMAIFEGVKDDLEKLVISIKETEDAAVKSQAKYESMMNWFQYAGNPPKRSKDAEDLVSTKEEMYQSMLYWQGDLSKKVESSTNIDELITTLDDWTDSEKIIKRFKWLEKKQWQGKNEYTGADILGLSAAPKIYSSDGTEIELEATWEKQNKDEKNIYDSAFTKSADLIATRVKELQQIFKDMLKSGKKIGAPVDPSDPNSPKYHIALVDYKNFMYGTRSIGAVPFNPPIKGKDNPWIWENMNITTTDNTSNTDRKKWGTWLATLCTDSAFEDLKKKLNSPRYVVAKSVPITNADRIKILGIIKERSEKYGAVEDATVIRIKPAKAIESRTKKEIPGEDIVTTTTEELNYAFPFSKAKSEDPNAKTAAEEMAITMFDSDSAIIKDNIKSQLSAGIDEMLAEIGKLGELVSLEYKTIASTSDEPSFYISPNKKGTSATREANIPLAKDRAASIETAFLALATEKGIDSTKIIKGTAQLFPNNTIGNTVVYETDKWMRKGTPQQQAEYKAKFAQPKYSGIAFKAQVKVTNTTVEPTTETVEDYSVTGEWGVYIGWTKKRKSKGGGGSSRYRGKINWNKIFPDMGAPGGGNSVKELCAAYG
jgi:hypothetical protein